MKIFVRPFIGILFLNFSAHMCLAASDTGTLTSVLQKSNGVLNDKEEVHVSSPYFFSQDLASNMRQSTPTTPNFPMALSAKFDISYQGAFRVEAKGDATSNYSVGVIEYNPDNDSVFLGGHTRYNSIAEFKVPSKLSLTSNLKEIVRADVLQEYVSVLDKASVGNKTNRITGMLYHKGSLLVNSEIWYDAAAKNKDNLLVISNAVDLKNASYKGLFRLEGAAKAAGYMSRIPTEWHNDFGGKFLTGWASNYSITSRYSLGPSLYVFDPDQVLEVDLKQHRDIATNAKMVFPYGPDTMMAKGATDYSDQVSPVWNILASARYAFIIPNSSTFMAIGSMRGFNSGIGYKATQNDGNKCGGGCQKDPKDKYNYFWLFDVNDILSAEQPNLIRPYSLGKWSLPFDNHGLNKIIGATFDSINNRLFVVLENAGRVGKYDRPPLVLVYNLTVKETK